MTKPLTARQEGEFIRSFEITFDPRKGVKGIAPKGADEPELTAAQLEEIKLAALWFKNNPEGGIDGSEVMRRIMEEYRETEPTQQEIDRVLAFVEGRGWRCVPKNYYRGTSGTVFGDAAARDYTRYVENAPKFEVKK